MLTAIECIQSSRNERQEGSGALKNTPPLTRTWRTTENSCLSTPLLLANDWKRSDRVHVSSEAAHRKQLSSAFHVSLSSFECETLASSPTEKHWQCQNTSREWNCNAFKFGLLQI